MKQKEIHRTATFAWSPTASLPLIATGTVAGALDESFSNESQLEIWQPDFMNKNEFYLGAELDSRPKGVVTDTSRFNRIAWGQVHKDRSRGVIAAGMENGELTLWDPAKIVQHADTSECLILRNTSHTGPVRGLDFNPIQTSLLSSGAVSGEVYIWDLNDPSKPYSPTPGSRSTKLDEITSVAWNQQVQYVLAGASSTGYTVVWDLRGKREVVALAYGGGAGTLGGAVGSGMAVGGRRGMSAIAWHPDNATRLVTASEDDMSPVIMVWDLRNARAPEKILTGHEKGVLSLSWCKQDADLLLSCGKDNRALCWNPQTSEIIGELPSADNWAFQVEWCPRNPDLLATAFFSGTIGIHSIQSTNAIPSSSSSVPPTPKPSGAELFDAPLSLTHPDQSSLGLSLKQPPRWLRRPVSASFGFGGKLVSVSNLPNAQGKAQSSVVHLRGVSGEKSLVERVRKLRQAVEEGGLEEFAEGIVSGDVQAQGKEGTETWKALLSLFRANSRDELVMLLGYSKEEVKTRVQQAIASLKEAQRQQTPPLHCTADEDGAEPRVHEPVVSFAEPEAEEEVEQEGETEADAEKTSSEVSVSDVVHADGESATTAPSLFGDDHIGMPQINADTGADFFSTMAASQETDAHETQTIVVPHTNYGIDSSVAATIGSGPSSVASASESLSLKSNTFRIYPSEESETDRLVTRALVLGDFESAVELCLESERYADALLLAIKGGEELLQRTQKAYFERRTTEHPYLRLFQSIVTNDLADVVQNADLAEWAEVFVVLCTFASAEEFGGLAEQLGARLEFQAGALRSEAEGEDGAEGASELRKTATLTYLAAGRLERLVNIWIEELAEEENRRIQEETLLDSSRYAAHAHALQTFIEKVTVFRGAIKYMDSDLTIIADRAGGPTKTYKLAALYDRYFEYAEMLAAQGLLKEAVDYLKLMPEGYTGSALDFAAVRERLLVASGQSKTKSTASASTKVADTHPPSVSTSLDQTGRYTPARPTYQPVQPPAPYQPYQSQYDGASTGYTSGGPYALQQSLVKPPSLTQPPPMRPPVSSAPPPPRTQNGGWNDAPVVKNERRTPSSLSTSKAKPDAIMSPFPNATQSPSTPGSPLSAQGPQLPPPARPASVQSRPPPPPQTRTTIPPSQGRPVTGPPPTRIMSPPQTRVPPPPPHAPIGSYSPPRMAPGQPAELHVGPTPLPPPGPSGGPVAPTAGPYARATPPPSVAAPPGPYAPPPIQAGQPTLQQQQPGPYAPPPQFPPAVGQPGSYAPPPVGQQHHAPPQVRGPPQGQHSLSGLPPAQQHGPPGGAPPAPPRAPPARAPVQRGPPPPKYPPGDRSHIPESAIPIYNVISEQLVRLKQTTTPQQRRMVEDLERRINPLFDALNCEALSKPLVDQLLVLTRAMEAHDRESALAIHVDLLTRGSQTDDIGLWMSAVKQLIVRL
ncbi:transport protein [Phlebopus sp. FC_14]|nr:transport protein [Phlebopus sp. FC_14]